MGFAQRSAERGCRSAIAHSSLISSGPEAENRGVRRRMQSVQGLTIQSFLPLSRMHELAKSAHVSYINAKPFPHIVLDDFFDPDLLDQILAEFPKPGEIRWQKFDNEREIKLASAREESFGPATRLLLYHLN